MAVYLITHTAATEMTRLQRAFHDMPAFAASDRTWFVDTPLAAKDFLDRIHPEKGRNTPWVLAIRVHRDWCVNDDPFLAAWLRDPARNW